MAVMCGICGNVIDRFSDKWKCKDGIFCTNCANKLDKNSFNRRRLYTIVELKNMTADRSTTKHPPNQHAE